MGGKSTKDVIGRVMDAIFEPNITKIYTWHGVSVTGQIPKKAPNKTAIGSIIVGKSKIFISLCFHTFFISFLYLHA